MPKLKLKRWLAIPISLILLTLFGFTVNSLYHDRLIKERQVARNEVQIVAKQIESLISDQIYQEQGLEAFVLSSPQLTMEQLSNYSAQLYRYKQPVFRSIALIKDTTVFFVYPLKGNEGALDVDLSTLSGQRQDVLFVKNQLKTKLAAPVNLVQGGRGIIIRSPIQVPSADGTLSYFGQVSLVIDYDALENVSGLNSLMKRYNLVITDVSSAENGEKFIYGNIKAPNANYETLQITLPSSTWRIAYYPTLGWQAFDNNLILLTVGGLVFSLLVGFYTWRVFDLQYTLNDTVHERTLALYQTNEYLEQTLGEVEEKQAELYLVNDQLEQSLEDLKATQVQLIQSEKFAALGELVAGVAHEINTPLGIGITLATYIQDQHLRLLKQFETGTLSKSQLSEYLESLTESLPTMVSSLNRSAEIISSFKNVAGEQSALELRAVNLHDFLSDVIVNLRPKFKNTTHQIQLNCPEDLVLYQYPGAFSHILTNLVVNSLTHGFENQPLGRIDVLVYTHQDLGYFVYTDNGRGIDPLLLEKVFDPFYTTKRSEGNTGLGMHIIHNIVTQTLKGKLELESELGKGIKLSITFPLITSFSSEG